ncbi:hypothetical protein RYX36_018464 [Vicia faba]
MDLENFVYEKVSEEIEARKEASERVPFHLHTPNALLSLVDDIDVLADSVSKQSGKVRGTSSYEDPQSSMVQDVDPSSAVFFCAQTGRYRVTCKNKLISLKKCAGNEGFDFVPPTGGDSFGRYEIALLCLGMMHFHFGHPKLALEVLTEAAYFKFAISKNLKTNPFQTQVKYLKLHPNSRLVTNVKSHYKYYSHKIT